MTRDPRVSPGPSAAAQAGPASWDEARARLHAAALAVSGPRRADPARRKAAPLAEAVGAVAAEAVRTPIPVPHYDSSAMDGYAVAGAPPWRLLAGHAADAAGENLHRRRGRLGPGEALPVLTGSLLPDGTEGVVRLEHAVLDGDRLAPRPEHPYSPGRDLRRAGEEMPAGTELLPAGTRLRARQLGMLGACGIDAVSVLPRPTAAAAYTGNEVIPHGIPGPGQVRDAFSAQFPLLLRGWGAGETSGTRLSDAPGEVEDWLAGTEADLLLLTGGSGHSGQDYVRRALEAGCTRILAPEVAMRPGHPTVLGVLPGLGDGPERLVLGLPGNPLAAHAALYSFAPVALAGLLGLPVLAPAEALLAGPVPGGRNPGVRILPCAVEDGLALPLPRSQSHMLSGLARADALAVVAAGREAAGDPVRLLPLD